MINSKARGRLTSARNAGSLLQGLAGRREGRAAELVVDRGHRDAQAVRNKIVNLHTIHTLCADRIDHSGGMAQENSANGGTGARASAHETTGGDDSPRHRLRLPHFIVHAPVGAGQMAKRITSAVGVKPCAPCEQRAARLDRWLRIEPRR
jgi:hypothetical protein